MKKKKMGLTSATFLGISSIIGSGWLFAPYRAAQVAGPAALLSWIIGASMIFLLAMCFAEIAAMYPKRGLSAIIPTLSHNKYFGFPFAIANWLGVVAVIGLEADATIQYLINLVPSLTSTFFHNDELTNTGVSLAIALVIVYCLLNYWGAKLLTKTNNVMSIVKLCIPLTVSLIAIGCVFHTGNFTHYQHSFVCYGYSSIFTAILTTGIIVAFNGFQTVISFSSEVKKPGRTIPLSLALAIGICLCVYLLLQIAFIGSIPSHLIKNGWHAVQLNAPMIQLAGMIGLGMLSSIIYFGATVAPTGAAIVFMGASSRMFTAMSRNKQMPTFFNKVNKQYAVSRRSLLLNTLLAIGFVTIFRSWSQLAEVLSLFHVISYLPIPIALIVFRNMTKGRYRSYILPCGKPISLLLFVFFTYLFTMADFNIVIELMIVFLVLHAAFIAMNFRSHNSWLEPIKKSALIVLYLIYLTALTYVSPHNSHLIHTPYFIALMTITSCGLFFFLTRSENNDQEVIEASVRIYQARKEDEQDHR